MTIVQQPDSLSYSQNLKKFRISSEVSIPVILKMGEVEIFDQTYAPGLADMIEIDLRQIIDRLLSVGIPTTNDVLTEQSLGVADFTLTIDTTDVDFRVVKGGVAEIQSQAHDFIDANLLSWQPQQKKILQYAPEWTGIYATAERKIKVKAYFADETTETIVLATCAADKLWSINVGWYIINEALTKKDPIAWDIWMTDSAEAVLSYVQRYQLRNASDQEILYLWVNTLGGIDSVSFTGYLEDNKKIEHKVSELIDETLDEYLTDRNRDIKQSTGYLDTEESRWLEDFFISPVRYRVRDDGAIKRIVVTESKVISSTADDQFDFEFTYRYSEDPALLNVDRTLDPLPAPEGLTDFFLTELLSSLTTALYQDNLYLAVQSPFAQGWQKLSFAQLWEQALPTLVDNVTIQFIDGKLRATGSISGGGGGVVIIGGDAPSDGLISGGKVTWISGYTYQVSAAVFRIGGVVYYSASTIITLDPSDPTSNRIDLIILGIDENGLGIVDKITGIASADPVKPQVDASIELELTHIDILGDSTVPEGMTDEVVYNDNIEWSHTQSGVTVDYDCLTNPFEGSKCAETGLISNGDTITFTAPEVKYFADYETFLMNIKLKGTIPTSCSLWIEFLLDGTVCTSAVQLDFDHFSLSVWQGMIEHIQAWIQYSETFDGVRIRWRKTGADNNATGFYFDYIKLQSGLTQTGNTQDIELIGDVTGKGKTGKPIETTLATVNATVGTFGSSAKTLVLTVNEKGLITGVTEVDSLASGSSHLYLAYASAEDGTGFSLTDQTLDYIAILSTTLELVPPVAADFAGLWKDRRGMPGADGQDAVDNLSADGLISGGIVTWISDYTYQVSAAVYRIGGIIYYSPSMIITLDPSDPTNNRIDLIILGIDAEGNGIVGKITGVASADPLKPQVDASIELELTQILILANSTAPEGVTDEIIFNENTEWSHSESGVSVNYDSLTDPFNGTKCAETGLISTNDSITFTAQGVKNFADYETFLMNINLKGTIPTSCSLWVEFLLDGNSVTSLVQLDFDHFALSVWQGLIEHMQSWIQYSDTFNGVRIKWRKTGPDNNATGFFFDYIKLQSGVSQSTYVSSLELTGDVTGKGNTGKPIETTLATVNSTVGIFGGASKTVTITVNEKGLVTHVEETDVEASDPHPAVTIAEGSADRASIDPVTQELSIADQPGDPQIQADWNQPDPEALDFIQNKPTLFTPVKKTWTAHVSQSGSGAPTFDVKENGIGEIGSSRVTAGTFRITSAGLFVAGKTDPLDDCMTDQAGNYYKMNWIDASNIEIITYPFANLGVPTDGILNARKISIDVYN